MKPQVALVLICFVLCEVFKTSTALKCFICTGASCTTDTCNNTDICCSNTTGYIFGTQNVKGCANKTFLNAPGVTCCSTDLCNSAEGVTLGLLMVLAPLLSSILSL